MTYQEIKDRLSKCELTLEKLKNGDLTSKDVQIKTEKLTLLKESYLKLLKEADKGVVYTDDEKKAKDLADDGVNVKLSDEIEENVQFSLDETKAIARKVGEAVAKALNSLGDEVGHMKAKKIEPNSFEIYVEYKNDNEDQFSFYITDDTLHLVDFSFDKEITDVGVKPSGEAVVNVDVIANELQKHFKSLSEKVDSKDTPELKKLSKALKGSSQAHLDQKKKLDKLINTEDLNEAPDDMYYIKVKKTDKASLNGLQDVIETWYSPVKFADIVDDDGAGNVIFYLKKSDWDPGMEDDIMGNGVQIVDTNMPLSEGEKETDDYGRPHVDPKGSRTFLEPDEMLPHNRFKKMAQKEDTDVGHQDDEPDMLQSTAFETAQYAAKLVKKLQKYDNFDGEVDFPNWWQAKLILAKDYMQKAYHYLASEEAQPAIDQLALEENVNKIAGGIPFKREGNKIIISEPLDDATKERIMKRAKEHGHHAAPNMAGGVTIMAKEGKYKSDAQRKAIYATKAEKGMDENRFLAASMDDLEQVIRNLAHTGEMSEDEAIELAIRKLEAMLDGRDDLDEGVAKTQKALDLVVSKMKELAKLYKAGDKSVVDQLKDLTAKKKSLEAMLDSDIADIGKDQELEIDEAGPGFKHDCAAKVVHEKYGKGNTIPEKHTLVKEGNKYVVTHYDVLFENGNTVLDIPVEDLKVETTNEHWHKGYKKKKK